MKATPWSKLWPMDSCQFFQNDFQQGSVKANTSGWNGTNWNPFIFISWGEVVWRTDSGVILSSPLESKVSSQYSLVPDSSLGWWGASWSTWWLRDKLEGLQLCIYLGEQWFQLECLYRKLKFQDQGMNGMEWLQAVMVLKLRGFRPNWTLHGRMPWQ